MKIVEWRIIYPFEYAKYVHAQDYMIARRQREESGGGEGIELITREPYTEGDETGIYAHKVYHYRSRIPGFIRWLVPNSLTEFHEEGWAAFPHEKLRYSVPALQNRTSIFIDCYSYPYSRDDGFPENPCHLTEEELAIREIRYMDIVTMPPVPTREDWQLSEFKCESAGIDLIPKPTRPFDPTKVPEWVENYKGKMMVNVKCIKCKINIFGFQKRIENMITSTTVPGIILESSRAITGWAEEWGKMSPEELQNYIRQSDKDVNDSIQDGEPENQEEKNQEENPQKK
ncbi:Phosphatidylinositol transfer protein 1 [Tritrichomonas foetus]|uniref:Phosphatidylinositol transfer protein 1 n=1 Tax=Tritrichomonas foetus TaxID=1144522 RepID=A0A1J4JZ48_9EUKA|nr:Phosphatidylinositol transfer protein 1 [Tritrichomonas foetus]|eukprot:OHT03970.1 Phosphatidylinositol transfer protein 1 [Tritrichomonas foetus]